MTRTIARAGHYTLYKNPGDTGISQVDVITSTELS